MTMITTAKTITLMAALALGATSALAGTSTSPLSSKAKTGHAAMASVKTQPRKPASTFAAARGSDSRAAIDQRPDVPGYPPAQAAQ